MSEIISKNATKYDQKTTRSKNFRVRGYMGPFSYHDAEPKTTQVQFLIQHKPSDRMPLKIAVNPIKVTNITNESQLSTGVLQGLLQTLECMRSFGRQSLI